MLVNDLDNNKEISLGDLIVKLHFWFKYILSKWIVILAFGVLGGLLGYIYANSIKPIYTATTTFVLENGESGGGMGQYAGIASMMGIDIGGGGGGIFQGDNIIELYKSRTMIERALLSEVVYNDKKHILIERFIEFNKLKDLFSKNPSLKHLNFSNRSWTLDKSRQRDSIFGSIVSSINTNYLLISKPDKKLNIFKVEIKSSDEIFSKLFNDKIVETVNDFYVQTKTKKSLDNVLILEEKADSIRYVMNGAIYSAARIADATPNLNPTRQIKRSAPIQRSQFNAETNKSILGEIVKNLEMSKMALLKETPLIQIVDHPIYPLDRKSFGKLKGIVIGGLTFGILIILFLVTRKLIKKNLVS